jgi:cobaltochelatase CobS
LFRINFDAGIERSEFIGSNTIEGGDVVWKGGVLTQAIRHAGAVILLDEVGFARAENISPLHAVTERSVHRALLIAETGENIPVSTGVVFFAADNSSGHGDESGNFAGVREQNSAFLDRFSYSLRFEYLCEDDEVELITKRTGLRADATRSLVKFANVARAKARAGLLTQPPSLRQLFAWASAVQEGMPVGLAFNNSIVHKFPADCEAELRGAYAASIDSAELKSYLVRK